MTIEYDYDPSLNVVHSQPSGNVSTSEISAYFLSVVSDDRISSDFLEVVHFGEVENFTFSSDQAEGVAIAFNKVKEKVGVRASIFIGKSDMQYGIGRMFQTFLNIYAPDHVVHVVRSEDEAEEAISGIIG